MSMLSVVRCAECTHTNDADQVHCGKCGAELQHRGGKSGPEQCQRRVRDLRCPLPATISRSVTGGRAQWCGYHVRGENHTYTDADYAALAEICEHPERYRRGPDWRDVLLKEHMRPDFYRRDDESAGDYRARLVATTPGIEKVLGAASPKVSAEQRRALQAKTEAERKLPDLGDVIEQIAEHASKLEAEMHDPTTALHMALQDVLCARFPGLFR